MFGKYTRILELSPSSFADGLGESNSGAPCIRDHGKFKQPMGLSFTCMRAQLPAICRRSSEEIGAFPREAELITGCNIELL